MSRKADRKKPKSQGGSGAGRVTRDVMTRKRFRQKRNAKLIALVISGGTLYPRNLVPIEARGNDGPDLVLWVNTDEREYTVVWANGNSPLIGGAPTLTVPANDKVHHGTSAILRVHPQAKAGDYLYKLTANNWDGGPGDPGFTVGE